MSEETPPSPGEFADLVLQIVLSGFNGDFDVPDVWKELTSLSSDDCLLLRRHLDTLRVKSPLVRDPGAHPRLGDARAMVGGLLGFQAREVTGAALQALGEALLVHHSQSPLVTGFAFHVKRLLNPDDPKYRLEDFVCPTPFLQLDVLEKSAHQCCASWLHKSAGDLSGQGHEEVWNSDAAAEIRRSVNDGSFRFCNKSACPVLTGGLLTPREKLMKDPWWAQVLTENTGRIDRMPRKVNLAYDRHCNLTCPSCRSEMITSNEEVRERLDQITQRAIYPLLASAEEVYVTGSGDPFASRTFRKMLAWISDETCPRLQVVLMTNGMLFTEVEWAKFPNLVGKVKVVKVSLDGASQETHERLRRGSRWSVMMENLPFIGRLLAEEAIANYELAFVVQEENFHEMGAFVDLAKRVGASQVYFGPITNWGTFSHEAYQAKAVFNPGHSRHREFLEVMADPRLRDPMVLLGGLEEFIPAGLERGYSVANARDTGPVAYLA